MTVNPLLASNAAASADSSTRLPARSLNQDDFLKLLVTQLTNQDPLKPQTDTEFVAQMTQFTNLEQTKQMNADIAKLRIQTTLGQSVGLLGQEVVVQAGDNPAVTGLVTGVEIKGGEAQIKVGTQSYTLGQVVSVSQRALQP